VYALNLFNVANRNEYRAYSRRSAAEVEAHGGTVVALGKFRREVTGEIAPRQVLILVEWESEAAFEGYRKDPAPADLHPHRENGSADIFGICSTRWTICGRFSGLIQADRSRRPTEIRSAVLRLGWAGGGLR
jgi:uncharacterized protein (DUF1330 family)